MIRPLSAADAGGAADFLDASTMVHRWLVAFFKHFQDLPREALPYWSLWVEARAASRGGETGVLAVIAHHFHTATSYVAASPDFQSSEVEGILERELLPERLVGDAPALARWEARSPAFFARACGSEELAVLALSPGELPGSLVPSEGFRPARAEDRPRLREMERLYALELGEEDPESDLASIIERELAFVLEEGGEVAAVVRSNLSDGRYIHLGGVFVHPAHRRKGLGTRLLAGLCERIHRAGLTALLDASRANRAALSAYGRVGFREVGRGRALRFTEDVWRAAGQAG